MRHAQAYRSKMGLDVDPEEEDAAMKLYEEVRLGGHAGMAGTASPSSPCVLATRWHWLV